MAYNTEKEKEKFIELLEKTPIVTSACEKMGISKSTYYRWRDYDPIFRNKADIALERGREIVNDLAESKVIALIQECDRWATAYWLNNNCSRYRQRSRYETDDSQPRTWLDLYAQAEKYEEKDRQKPRDDNSSD